MKSKTFYEIRDRYGSDYVVLKRCDTYDEATAWCDKNAPRGVIVPSDDLFY